MVNDSIQNHFMRHSKFISVSFLLVFSAALFFISCSKKESVPAPPPVDPCAGKTIIVSSVPAAATPCGDNGSITASATGSAGFTYKLNSGGTYQSSGLFSNVSAGTYTVFAKDAAGCEKSTAVTVAAPGSAGVLFTAVKNLMTTKCQLSCHNNTVQNGGMNWAVDCNIVQFKNRIKVRAVDEGTMPQSGPLPQSEKDIITNWINAGGKFTD